MTTESDGDVLRRNASVQMAAARFRLSEKRPYISHALFAITMRPLAGHGTVGVDRHWRLVYDPATVVTWTVPEVAGVLYHEVWHLLRDHAGRAAGRDPQVWNLACDAEINDDLVDEMKDDERQASSAFKLPGEPVIPASFGMPDGLTAEEYYDRLVKQQTPQSGGASPQSGGASPQSGGASPQSGGASPQSGGASPQSGGASPQSGDASGSADGEPSNATQRGVASGRCGSAATGVAEPWEATIDGDDQSPDIDGGDAPDTRISPGEACVIRGVVAAEIARNRGTVPGHALLLAERELAPGRVDWRAELRSVIARTMATVAGAIDYSYARPSRRQSALANVIMPSLREPVVRVAIVVDTSGSMSVPDLGVAMREIEKIIKGFGKNDAVPVFSVDAAVRARQRVRNVAEVRLVGGGGTDMREGIEEALMQRPRPDVAIVLTDGYTPWPDSPPPGMRVMAGIIGGNRQGVPEWMRTVHIDPDDLRRS